MPELHGRRYTRSDLSRRTGRLATTADVGAAVVLLCSPEAGFVTGQALAVDGGYTIYGAAHPVSRAPRGPD